MRNPFKRHRDDAPDIDVKGLVRPQGLDRDQIAELLRTTPAAVDAFEDAYRTRKLDTNIDESDLFGMNSRQAAAMTHGNVDEAMRRPQSPHRRRAGRPDIGMALRARGRGPRDIVPGTARRA